MARFPNSAYAWFRSQGFTDEEAVKEFDRLERSLIDGTVRLTRLSRGCSDSAKNKVIHIDGISDGLLAHALMPEWSRFVATLTSVNARRGTFFHLHFEYVVLDGKVSDMLLDAFAVAPLQTLYLQDCENTVKFASNVLKVNSTLEVLGMASAQFDSKYSAIGFARNVIDHPALRVLGIDNSGIGSNNAVLTALIPILGRVQEVSLAGNCIASRGATLIANFLATNPCVKQLDLNENHLNDKDAAKFAASLETNTNLRKLTLKNNVITKEGVDILIGAMVELNTGSLNALVDCNHTCAIDIVPRFNRDGFPRSNRIAKFIGAIHYCTEYIDDVPIELFPRVFALLQGGGIVNDEPLFNGLFTVYTFVCQWNGRLFDTSGERRGGPNVMFKMLKAKHLQ